MKKWILPLLVFFIFTSCNKGNEEDQQPAKDMSGVYISGHDIWGTNSTPKIWKNGTSTNLSNGVGITVINSVFVSDKAVYAVGKDEVNFSTTALRLWKDDVVTSVPASGITDYKSVFVSGDDVYIAGTEQRGNHTVAMLWKNGVPIWIAGSSGWPAKAEGIAVHNGDVYIAGVQYDFAKQMNIAQLWKNGVATELSTVFSGAQRIKVASNGDVYVHGYEQMNSVIWKNGQKIHSIATGYPDYGYFRSMFIDGSDLYVAGFREINNYPVPFLRKNGVESFLNTNANWGTAEDVFVKGSDVYVIGREPFAGGYARGILWKNGVRTPLTDGSSNTVLTSIFVK